MRLRKAARVILVGAPGVGKGTQSERLLQRFPELQYISSGDLLRNNVKNKTPLGIKVENTIKKGGLVSDDLILRLISSELFKRGWISQQGAPRVMTLSSSATTTPEVSSYNESSGTDPFMAAQPRLDGCEPPRPSEEPSASFLLDGFPRTASQANVLGNIVPINLAVSIKTPFDVVMQRIAGRWVHEPSGRVYNTTFNAPKFSGLDDITGERLVQRPDDNPEVYKARFRKFEETSEPLLEHYARKGVLWEVGGMSSDEISPKLFAEFERRFVH